MSGITEAQELNEPATKVDRLPAKLLAVYTRDVADGVGGETFGPSSPNDSTGAQSLR